MKIPDERTLAGLKFDPDTGLLPVIAQHATTGEVLMLAYANREAVERTIASGQLWFYSRSRAQLWRKGETSGNTLDVVELAIDCDADTLLARVMPAGPACHTGARNCFNTAPTLTTLADVLQDRAAKPQPGSYTTRLLGDENLRLKKIGEEAAELIHACSRSDRDRVAEEAADLLYHALVACQAVGVGLTDVLRVLDARRR